MLKLKYFLNVVLTYGIVLVVIWLKMLTEHITIVTRTCCWHCSCRTGEWRWEIWGLKLHSFGRIKLTLFKTLFWWFSRIFWCRCCWCQFARRLRRKLMLEMCWEGSQPSSSCTAARGRNWPIRGRVEELAAMTVVPAIISRRRCNLTIGKSWLAYFLYNSIGIFCFSLSQPFESSSFRL